MISDSLPQFVNTTTNSRTCLADVAACCILNQSPLLLAVTVQLPHAPCTTDKQYDLESFSSMLMHTQPVDAFALANGFPW
jgi:hypothetical protein